MFRKNEGRVDRILRLIVGVALVPIGLVALGGWQGTLTGIVVTVLGAAALATAATGFCPAYVPFGISTLDSGHRPGGAVTT